MPEEHLLPDEISEQGKILVHDLRHLHDTSREDQQSLARIRQRFLQKSANSLPVIEHVSNEELIRPYGQIAKRTSRRSSLQTRWKAQQVWSRRLTSLAAIFLIAILIGSLALILAQARQTTVGSLFFLPFQPEAGWEPMASYSGTGSETINKLSISLPHLYHVRVRCSGAGVLEILLENMTHKTYAGLNPCTQTSPSSEPYTYDLTTYSINKITVTAQSEIRWYLQIDRADKQPNFTLQPFWQELTGGGGNNRFDADLAPGSANPATNAKTWGLVITCRENERGKIQLVPDVGDIQITSCSLQPQLLVIHYPYPTQVTDITVFMSKTSWFDVHLVSCQDEAKCHLLPSAPTIKVKDTKKGSPIGAPY